MARLVMKFGGTSVGDLDRIRRAADRIKAAVDDGFRPAVVASAMTWVYAINVVPPAVSVYLVLRMLRLAERERRAPR